MQIIFNKHIWPPVSLGFSSVDSTNYEPKTVILIHSWESTYAEGQFKLYEDFHGGGGGASV